jgi:chromosome segregation ATPase
MSKMILCVTLVFSLLACKEREDRLERAKESADEAKESVREQREDVREEERDVAEEQRDVTEEQRDIPEERKDVKEEKSELGTAQAEFAQARTEYENAAKKRLATVDERLRELAARPDPEARQATERLRVQRDQLAQRIETIGTRTAANWEDFRKDVDQGFERLDEDITDAMDAGGDR